MAFSCRLYKSTGFNTINVPDRPSLLDSFSYVDTDVIDVLSTYNNSVIRVKLSQAPDWQYYDYLRIGSGSNIANRAYYAITGFRFTSPDVIEFRVVQDSWLTLGGLDGFTNGDISILSGTTNRHHIPKADDTYSDYNEPDEMLIPSDPIEVLKVADIGGYFLSAGSSTANTTVVKTSIDLKELGTQLPEVINFPTQSISGDVTGDIPSPADFCYPKLTGTFSKVGLFSGSEAGFIIQSGYARPKYHGTMGQQSAETDVEFTLPNESFFVTGNASGRFQSFSGSLTNVNKGVARARGMGYDTAITASYSLPQGAVSGTVHATGNGAADILVGMLRVDAIKSYNDVNSEWSAGQMDEKFEFEYWARNPIDDGAGQSVDLNNIRAIKGDYFKYELIALASGQKTEFLGEDIVKASSELSASGTVYKPDLTGVANAGPVIMTICDPRPTGCPYFTYYNDRNFINMYNNSIKGLKWTEAPIRYEVNSGAAVESRRIAKNTQFTDASAHFNNLMSEADYNIGGINRVAGSGGASVDSARRLYGWGFADDSTKDAQKIVQRAAYGGEEYYRDQIRRQIDRASEEEEFYVNANVQVPEINFPINDSIKEAVGNGALLVRYTLTGRDIAKFDKILNMYGYKNTAAIDESMLSNRSKYNYIEAAGVTFGGNAAKFLREDLANMFRVGIRIWHVAPDPALYVGTSNA